MITSAPLSRSGGASGMLGTARLLGQTVGAALVALIFGLSGHTTVAALVVAAAFAACGGIASLLRLSPARTPPAR
jgi:DHA2 family multidrug resistance protein-like MFS transporter